MRPPFFSFKPRFSVNLPNHRWIGATYISDSLAVKVASRFRQSACSRLFHYFFARHFFREAKKTPVVTGTPGDRPGGIRYYQSTVNEPVAYFSQVLFREPPVPAAAFETVASIKKHTQRLNVFLGSKRRVTVAAAPSHCNAPLRRYMKIFLCQKAGFDIPIVAIPCKCAAYGFSFEVKVFFILQKWRLFISRGVIPRDIALASGGKIASIHEPEVIYISAEEPNWNVKVGTAAGIEKCFTVNLFE